MTCPTFDPVKIVNSQATTDAANDALTVIDAEPNANAAILWVAARAAAEAV